MSTDRPEEFDDVSTLRPIPPGGNGDDRERDEYRDHRPTPPTRAPGFGFWLAVVWALLYFVVTQLIAGVLFTVLFFGIALAAEITQKGGCVDADPCKLM